MNRATIMPLDDQQAWALLHQLDDPDHLEVPRGYNHAAARARFDQLATRLDDAFACACHVDCGVQDASHHGTILIPETATSSPDHITITVSNFGDLVAVTLGNPGCYDADEEREYLLPDDRGRIDRVLDEVGYVAISEHLLDTPYGGVSNSLRRAYPDREPTWWIRYFDYI